MLLLLSKSMKIKGARMEEFRIQLSDYQQNQIKEQLYKLIISEIENVRKSVNLDLRYMNKKQTCRYLQVSNNTLDKWISLGLPLIKIGGSVRFDKKLINEWLNSLTN